MPLHSHRAPATPLRERGRYAMVTVTLLGVGVTGAATGDAALSHPRTADVATAALPAVGAAPQAAVAPPADHHAATPPAVPPAVPVAAGGDAGAYQPRHAVPAAAAVKPSAKPTPRAVAAPTPSAGTAFAPARLRVRPAPTPQWVHPMPEGRVTSCFGQRWGRLHAGVDLAAPHGTPVRAAGAGTVVTAGVAAGYGNAILIDHGNGYLTHYGHLSALTVQAGQRVTTGAQIGNEGSTGHSTGPHLHFEVHQGSYQNPIEPTAWMHAHGADITGC